MIQGMIPSEKALSVSELNEYVRRLLAGDPLLRNVEVTGEISGYKHHISGHRYFSLKDADARVQCVMFRQSAMGLDFRPEDGQRVTVRASASLFSRDGSYQLYVNEMRKNGVGDLYLKFEALKEKLAKEGLFDPAIKRPIPMLPSCIGIATSRTGAALRDMVRIARRRNPNVDIIIAPCSVQGADAAGEIVEALRMLEQDGRPDVILVGRGGGSIEDLWAFNEEIVARAIAACDIPVISCVGHETDFTISDFVADVRAATPSMAAEIAVPVAAELRRQLNVNLKRVASALWQGNQLRWAKLERIAASEVFSSPARLMIEKRREQLALLNQNCDSAQRRRMEFAHMRLEKLAAKLEALDPASVLERGYACVSVGKSMISSAAELSADMQISIRFRDGTADATIVQTKKSENTQ